MSADLLRNRVVQMIDRHHSLLVPGNRIPSQKPEASVSTPGAPRRAHRGHGFVLPKVFQLSILIQLRTAGTYFNCDLAAISNNCSAVGLSHPSPIAACA